MCDSTDVLCNVFLFWRTIDCSTWAMSSMKEFSRQTFRSGIWPRTTGSKYKLKRYRRHVVPCVYTRIHALVAGVLVQLGHSQISLSGHLSWSLDSRKLWCLYEFEQYFWCSYAIFLLWKSVGSQKHWRAFFMKPMHTDIQKNVSGRSMNLVKAQSPAPLTL